LQFPINLELTTADLYANRSPTEKLNMPHFCKLPLITLLFALWSFNAGAQMHAPEIMQKQQECRNAAKATLEQLYQLHPAAKQQIRQAAGYAAFEQVGLKFLIVGGGSGKGLAVDNRTGQVTYMQITDSLEEVAVGIKQYSAVFLFETRQAYNQFLGRPCRLANQVAKLKPGRNGPYAGAVNIAPGVWLYQIADNTLLAELNVKGPIFSKYDDLNHGL
jgi:lipid-binding SYLF domain-containing protein